MDFWKKKFFSSDFILKIRLRGFWELKKKKKIMFIIKNKKYFFVFKNKK